MIENERFTLLEGCSANINYWVGQVSSLRLLKVIDIENRNGFGLAADIHRIGIDVG